MLTPLLSNLAVLVNEAHCQGLLLHWDTRYTFVDIMFVIKELFGFHFGEKAEFLPTYRFKSAFPIGAYVNRANV